MYPSSGDYHSVSLCKVNLENLINHIAQPRVHLDLRPRPLFVRCEVGYSGPDEIENLARDVKRRFQSHEISHIPLNRDIYGNIQMSQQNLCANPNKT